QWRGSARPPARRGFVGGCPARRAAPGRLCGVQDALAGDGRRVGARTARAGGDEPAVRIVSAMSAFFWLFGLLNLANGCWMLVAPASWYHGLPASVPDTGPLNPHFVRDIGAAFITIGVALCIAAPGARRHPAVLRAPAHWAVDFPGVFLPAIVLAVLSLPRWCEA